MIKLITIVLLLYAGMIGYVKYDDKLTLIVVIGFILLCQLVQLIRKERHE